MKQFYQRTTFLRKACCVLLLLFIGANGVFAQAETEPNNEANQAGTQRIYEGTTITGTVSNTDPDFWNMSKLPVLHPANVKFMFITSGHDTGTITIDQEIREGGYDGSVNRAWRSPTVVFPGSTVPGHPYAQVGWAIWENFAMATRDTYSVLRITTTSATPVAYSLVLQSTDFPACTTPASATGLSTTATGATSLQLDAFSAVSGISGGYVVEINDSPTFSALPTPQFDAFTSTTPSTAYSGSGQQVVYTSPIPVRLLNGFNAPPVPGNINVTGLNTNTTYYYRVTTVNECDGYMSYDSGAIVSGKTCGDAPNQVSGIATANNSTSSFEVNSFGAPIGGADGYVIKVNKINSFTAPTSGASLPSATTSYNIANGEQVVYAGGSNTPNVTISGSGISAGDTFYAKVYAYYDCGGIYYFENVGTTVSLAICNGAPSVTPSALSIDQISYNAMRVNSTSGAGGATGQVILINTVNSFTPPTDGALPVTNTVYSGTGQQVIYAGNAVNPAVTVTNLTNANGGTQYFFKSYAYNSCGTGNHLEATGVTTNATTCGAVQNVASNATFFEVSDSFMDLNSFSAAAGATGYVVKMNTVNTFTAPTDGSSVLPTQNTNYTGGEQVVYAGTSATPDIRITGLSAATTYHFNIYSYTNCNGVLFYEQTGYNFSRQNINPSANLTFNDFSVTYDGAPFDMNTLVTSLSPGAMTYSIVGGTSPGGNVLSGTGNSIMDSGTAGTVLIQVTQAAAANYNSSTVQATMTIEKADPALSFEDVLVSFGAANQTLAATSPSTGTISYSIIGAAPSGNVLSGTNNETWTPGDAGTFTIRASITTDVNYNAASKDATFAVAAPATTYVMADDRLIGIVNGVASNYMTFTGGWPGTNGTTFNVLEGALWSSSRESSTNGKGAFIRQGLNGTSPSPYHFPASPSVSTTHSITSADGKIWMVTNAGGTARAGEIYSRDINGGNTTLVHAFDASAILLPYTGITEYNGVLYGTCGVDVVGLAGGIYSLTPDGSGGYTYAVEHTFASTNNNKIPIYGFVVHDNLLWYTNAQNYLVAYDPATGTFPHSIYVGSNIFNPIVANNTLYVATRNNIYEIASNYSGATNIHTFSGMDNSGQSTFDGDHIVGIARDHATGTGLVYNIKPNGTGFQITYTNPTTGQVFVDRAMNLVEKLTPVITFADQTVDHLSVTTLNATSNSTGAISYELIGDTTSSGLSGSDFTAGDVGTVTIRATLASDANFEAATFDATFTIAKADPTFTIADINASFDGADITLAPSATNYTGGTVVYQFVDPTDTNTVATTGFNTGSSISGDQLTLGTPGIETIRATLTSTSNFNTATFDIQLTIGNGIANLSGFADFAVELFQSDVTLNVPSAPGVAMSYQLLTSNTGSSLSGINNETLSVGTTTGTETIRVTVTEPNYNPITKDITLTVNKATPIITWGTPPDVTVGIEPLDGTHLNAVANVPGVFSYTYDGFNPITSGVTALSRTGVIQLDVAFLPDDQINYSHTTASVNINVTKIDITIKADDITILFGDPEPALTYSITAGVVVPGHSINVPLTRVAGTALGDYAITVNNTVPTINENDDLACSSGICIYDSFRPFGGNDLASYNLTFVPGTLSIINKTPITVADITFNTPASLLYDGTAKTYTVTPDAGLSPTLPTGDIDLTYEGRNGTVYASSATAPTNAGDYMVTATVNASNSDYTGGASLDFSITPVDVTITADAKSKTFGDTDPALTYQLTAGALQFSDAFTGSLSRNPGESVGTYAIAQGDVTAGSNYTITFVPDDLTIGQRDLEITADATSKTYGDADPTLTYQITAGALQFSDVFAGSLSRVAGEDIGTYAIEQGSVTAGGNYNITFVSNDLSINQRAIEITADALNKQYGDTDPVLTYQITAGALQFSDAFTGVLDRVTGENVGDYAINQGNVALNSNYTLSYISNDLTIGQRAIEITADALNKAFGDVDPALTYQITTGSLSGSDAFTGNLVRVTGENIGTYAINQGDITLSPNYNLSYVGNNFEITKATAVVTINDIAQTYDGSAKPVSANTTPNGLTVDVTYDGGTTVPTNAGTYAVVATINDANYQGTANETLTINKADQTITFGALSVVTYGDANFNVTATASSGLTTTYTSSNTAVATVSGTTVTIIGAGATTITANQAGDANYNTATNVPQVLVVGKKDLEVTPIVTSIEYGLIFDISGTVPLAVTGFVNGDDINTLTPSGASYRVNFYTFSNSQILPRDVGVHPNGTRVDGGYGDPYEYNSNYNYVYSFVPLEVVPFEATITADVNQTKMFGDVDPTLAYTVTPLPVPDAATGKAYNHSAFALSGSLERVAGENVGTYAINQGSLVAITANYNVTFVANNFEITPADVIVTVDAKSKIYGDSDPALTYTVTTGSSIGSGAFTGSLERVTGENAGTYAINQGTLVVNPNYALTFVGNDLTISPRPIGVIAEVKSKTYGDTDPALTYGVYIGSLVNGDVLTGALTREPGEDVGAYEIRQGTVDNENYSISFRSDNLYITSRAIEITADVQSITYGDVDPALTYQITTGSLVGSDVFTGNLSRVLGEDVGTYEINQGTLDNSNYDITFVSNDLTIAQRNILVLAEGKSKTYGDSDPILTYRIGLGSVVGSDTFSGSIIRTSGEDVGTYTISQGTLTLGANYNMIFSDNALMIFSRTIEVMADDQIKIIGATDPMLTYQITSGALQFSDAVSGDLIRVTGETLGDYAINQGTLSVGSNYNLTFISGNLNITNLLPQVITFGALADQTFGGADFTLNATGGASGNPITYTSSNTSVATVNGNTVTIVGAGNTSITASQAGNATYAPATDVSQSLTINKADQMIMFDALADVTTDSADFNLTANASSGLNVTYISSNPAVATVSGNTVTVVGIGTTTITASQTGDTNWNAASDVLQTLAVLQADIIAPVITLAGNNPQIINLGDGYTELGATTDDGSAVVIDATNFVDTEGSYTIRYNATDAVGNVALEATRTVNVVNPDTTAPVITLTGANPQVIVAGDGYTELGATTDDGSAVVIDATDFVDAIGSYTIRYNATDAVGNIATEVTRIVNVVAICPFVILPTDNFQIQASSETCTDKNNGIVIVNAIEALDYMATINGQTYNFTSNLAVSDLAPGTYSLCIAINGFDNCEQCFELVIDEAPILSGKTTVQESNSTNEVLVEINSGTAPYTVMINDEVVGEYTTDRFAVEVKHGDTLDVSSNSACEGKISTTISLYDTITAYPNPTKRNIELTIPNIGESTIAIEVRNAIGVSVSSSIYSIINGGVMLPMENLPTGVYFVNILGGVTRTIKVIKE